MKLLKNELKPNIIHLTGISLIVFRKDEAA